jgi:hypothetical protein
MGLTMKQDYTTYRIYKKLLNPVQGRRKLNLAGFSFFLPLLTLGYFEISDTKKRFKNNRVYVNTFEKFRASDSLNTRPVIARANKRACLDWDK